MHTSMKLVNKKEFASASKLDKIGLGSLSGALMNALKLSDINELYDKCKHKDGIEFIDALFKEIHVEFTFFPEELSRIPKNGAFITVSNHPLGGVDGIILIKLLAETRPDYKVMVNFILQKVEPLKEFFMPVNPFDNIDKSSLPGLKEAIQYVKNGHGLGIFPAGEVSTYNFDQGRITDKKWQEGAIKLIRKMDVPVVPIYFKARNSFWFYFLSGLHPMLRTAKLPSEVFNKRNKSIQVRIGNPILPKEWAEMDIDTTRNFLHRRTYLLAKTLPPRKSVIPRPDFTFLSRRKHDAPQPIIDAASYDVVEGEFDALRA
jgi:putative hemolysin